MTDFIPGEAYRLDIIAADNKTIVDSWQNKIRANVVSDNGAVQVDVSTGKLYGPLVGNIEDADGNLIFNLSAQVLISDLEGSVYDATGNKKLVDGTTGKIVAPSYGNLEDTTGAVIVNTAERTVVADSFTGDLYGDVYGNITADSVIYGTFSGDFNGTAYGEFFGNSTGEHTGSVTGEVIGNVTGNVIGNLNGFLIGDNLDSETVDETPTVKITNLNNTIPYPQYSFYGGLEHHIDPDPDALANGPIVYLGATRADTSVRAHLHHYNGTEIIKLHDPIDPTCTTAPATIRGQFDGNFIYTDENGAQDALTVSAQGTVLHAVNGGIAIGGYPQQNDQLAVDINVYADFVNIETPADDVVFNVKSYNGTLANKTTVLDGDHLAGISSEVFNGNGYVTAGGFGLFAEGNPKSTDNYAKSKFMVVIPNTTQGVNMSNSNILEYDSNGILSVPVFRAKGHTFATRDAMTAQTGMIVFNTSSNKFQGYTGTAWVDLH